MRFNLYRLSVTPKREEAIYFLLYNTTLHWQLLPSFLPSSFHCSLWQSVGSSCLQNLQECYHLERLHILYFIRKRKQQQHLCTFLHVPCIGLCQCNSSFFFWNLFQSDFSFIIATIEFTTTVVSSLPTLQYNVGSRNQALFSAGSLLKQIEKDYFIFTFFFFYSFNNSPENVGIKELGVPGAPQLFDPAQQSTETLWDAPDLYTALALSQTTASGEASLRLILAVRMVKQIAFCTTAISL